MWGKSFKSGAWGRSFRTIVIVTPKGLKLWDGFAWVIKPLKVWTAEGWKEKPIKRWNGTQWVTVGVE